MFPGSRLSPSGSVLWVAERCGFTDLPHALWVPGGLNKRRALARDQKRGAGNDIRVFVSLDPPWQAAVLGGRRGEPR